MALPQHATAQSADVMEKPAFLGVLDRQMGAYVGREGWDRFFTSALLFENRLCATDVLFFNSAHLWDHLREAEAAPGRLSLFELALKEKLIVPAFRTREPSFREAFQRTKTQGLLGMQPWASELADRLDRVWQANSDNDFVFFPEAGARVFAELSHAVFSTELPPLALQEDESAISAWKDTEAWRTTALAKALASARKPGELRRGDWIEEIASVENGGTRLSPEESAYIHNDNSRLLELLPHHRQGLAGLFLRWLNECYQASSATVINAVPSFPGSVPQFAVIPYSLLRPTSAEDGEAEVIRVDVRLPAIHVLKQLPAKKLLDIRQDAGTDYLNALRSWQKHDPATDSAKVEGLWVHYADQLCLAVKQTIPSPQTRIELGLGRWRNPLAPAISLLITLMKFPERVARTSEWTTVSTLAWILDIGWRIYRMIDLNKDRVGFERVREVDLIGPAGDSVASLAEPAKPLAKSPEIDVTLL